MGNSSRRGQSFAVLGRLWLRAKSAPLPESRLELAAVLVINAVLWTMVAVEIWGAMHATAPLIGGVYPVA